VLCVCFVFEVCLQSLVTEFDMGMR
jgi:hypothetical protein